VFNIVDETVPIHVNFLHDEVRCLSNDDIRLKFLGFFLLIYGLFLRLIYSKLKKFSRNPLSYESSLDSSDFFQEIVLNGMLVLSHMISVVLPNNRTKEQVDKIVEDYNKKFRVLKEESKAHLFSGVFRRADYTIVLYMLLVALAAILFVKNWLIRRQPWLDRDYNNLRLAQITVVEFLLEFRIILEFFNTYGILNYYMGELNAENISRTPSLPV
jgi:hypothetical protein